MMSFEKLNILSPNIISDKRNNHFFQKEAGYPILIVSENFEIIYANDLYKKIYNENLHWPFIGENLNECTHIEFNKLVTQINKVFKGVSIKSKLILNSDEDESMNFQSILFPLYNPQSKINYVGIVIEENQNTISDNLELNEETVYKSMIDFSSDVYILGNENLEIKFTNKSIGEELGYTNDELVNTSLFNIVHKEDASQLDNWLLKLLHNNQQSLLTEIRLKHKNNSWIWFELNGRNLLKQKGMNAIYMCFRNIQIQKIVDETLVVSEQRLSLLLNNTVESFIILNNLLKVVSYNKAAQEHSPYFFANELQSDQSILELVNKNELPEFIELFEQVFAGTEMMKESSFEDHEGILHIYEHQFRPLKKDDTDEIHGVFITSKDITDKKFAEEKLKENDVKYNTINKESFDAVLIVNNDKHFSFCSPAIENILGYTSEELLNTSFENIVHPDLKQNILCSYQEIQNDATTARSFDILAKHKSGHYLWIELKLKNMYSNPLVNGILISLRDISSRKQSEEQIFLSEQRFRGMVQSGADLISIIDENGTIQYTSNNSKTLFQINPEECIGKYFFHNIIEEDVAVLKEKLIVFLASNNRQLSLVSYRIINGNGFIQWVESTFTNMLSDIAIKGIVVNSTDITERKHLSEELVANTDRLLAAQKIAKLGYIEYNIIKQRIYCSDEISSILGITYTAKDIRYLFPEILIHADDRERVQHEINLAIAGKKILNTEYRIQLPNGVNKIISALGELITNKNNEPEKFSLTIQDITESKKAQEEIKLLENRLKSIFDNAIDGILISALDGNIISANPSLCELTGYSGDEIISLNRFTLYANDEYYINTILIEREINGSWKGELNLKHKNGQIIPVDISSVIIRNDSGLSYASTIIRDIREKKKNEAEQKLLTEELVKNNQDLKQFSYITSHNLRAPVANLLSLLSIYNKEDKSDPYNEILVEKFEEATTQLNSTLNDLINILVIKSKTNIEREPLKLSDTFVQVKLSLQNIIQQAKANIVADFTAIDELEYTKVHLESIFLNMLTNAIKYCDDTRPLKIKISSEFADNMILVKFEDNGIGIDLERCGDRLFGLYQRFHETKDGKGLGLYMIKSQVISMGGKIEVESELGKGTIFKIYFKTTTQNATI